ncbi:hypothetical protein VTK26DRAFT_6558 [Humicola hyalothermophila]
MLLTTFSLLAVAAQLANAHFGVDYPPMRADTLGASALESNYSQWTNPCAYQPSAPLPQSFPSLFHPSQHPPTYLTLIFLPPSTGAGVPGNLSDAPRTDWPLTGGSVVLDLRHAWTYLFINLGLGANAANFNYTLTDPFLNVTGNGTLCIPKLALPAGLPVSDGSPASLQVVTVGDDGNALYNCADITFRENATELAEDRCQTGEGMPSYEAVVGDQQDGEGAESKAAIGGVSILGMTIAGITALIVGGSCLPEPPSSRRI